MLREADVLHRRKKSRTSKFSHKRPPKVGPDEVGEWITFTAFSDPVSLRRRERALGQINIWREHNGLPLLAGEDLKGCNREIVIAVRSVEYFKEIAPYIMGPRDRVRKLKADAKLLRTVAKTIRGRTGELLHLARDEAERLDVLAFGEQPRVPSARERAVDLASRLLTRFGGKAPGLSVEGPWIRLSKILLSVRGANVFEAMRRAPRP